MGVGSFLIVLFAVLTYQLADRDNRKAWLWTGGYVAAVVLLARVPWLGALSVYVAFIGVFIALIATNPIQRKW